MRPVITLTTDFGLCDSYVAQLKAVLLRACPEATIVDITHAIPRHDILRASIMLENAVAAFPPGTIHLAVVDPGVGTRRRLLLARIAGQFIICPDNGLITWPWRLHKPASARRITWRPKSPSHTFHGRDIMAPVAAMLATGRLPSELSQPLRNPILLDIAPANPPRIPIRVIAIDSFGNATTNLPEARLRDLRPRSIHFHGQNLGPHRHTYADVPPRQPLALIGSSGLLEIAANQASAAELLHIHIGDRVELA